MFEGLFGKAKPQPLPQPLRNPVKELLYGDLPLDRWPRPDSTSTGFPGSDFVAARVALGSGQVHEAVACWQRIVSTPGLESLYYVQAWHFLRQNGVIPPTDQAKRVFGVIVEIGASGVLIAAYSDHQARLYTDQGGGVVWCHADNSLDAIIDAIFEVSAQVVQRIGPWDKARLPAPVGDLIRISFLTPSGLHFGQGPSKVFSEDPLSKHVLQGASALMRALMQKTGK